jgi:long-chain acyl-CoA synthetase
VKSFVVVRAGAAVTADELKQYCRAELAAYKIPRIIEFRDSLPKSTVQKVLRRELRAQEVARASTRESS